MELDIISRQSQAQAVELGQKQRSRLIMSTNSIPRMMMQQQFGHLYLYSLPGFGKTYEVTNLMHREGIKHMVVSGNASFFAFGVNLALAQYKNPDLAPMVIVVDDCDALINNVDGCNIMKNMLEGVRCYRYMKAMGNLMRELNADQQAAIEYFKKENELGFTVPTQNLTFVFTSNIRLPEETDQKMKQLVVHQLALRSRCTVVDFDLTDNEAWGRLYHVCTSTNFLEKLSLTEEQALEIMDFLWVNWSILKEKSIRTIEKMAIKIANYPENYLEWWEVEFVSRRFIQAA